MEIGKKNRFVYWKTAKAFAEKFEQNAFLYGLKNQMLEIVY